MKKLITSFVIFSQLHPLTKFAAFILLYLVANTIFYYTE